jgi:all-trans-retinol dehydrogenase (NAD+)
MSASTQRFFGILLGPVKGALLEPTWTGPLLWSLTSAPSQIHDRVVDVVSTIVGAGRIPQVVRILKWLFVLGLIRRANGSLNQWALDNWCARRERKKWEWEKEVAVVTGGCSGIGKLTVQGLVRSGITVAVIDIQPLPADIQNRMYPYHPALIDGATKVNCCKMPRLNSSSVILPKRAES